MAITSPQTAPLRRRRRRRLKVAGAAAAVLLFVLCIDGTDVCPLLLVLATAWALQANEVRNGRR